MDTGRNVYLQPSLASQGIKGTVTNALASAFVGSLGGGKSFCNNLIVYYSVLFGGQAVILDPKSERGNWKETLPEIAHEINIVNLTSDKENAGLLDPFVIMKNVKDAESLAIDILTFLTGISSRDGEKFPVLRKAVRAVTQSDQRGLLHVIDELRREDTAIARNIADHIDSFTDYDFAHLLFSDGSVSNAISLDNQLNIIQVADLVLPDKDTTFEEYTTIELLSVAMLIVISTFALDFIHSDRSIFKIVDLDEAWAFLNVAQGETLSNKLVRAGRAMQAGVYFVTQSSGELAQKIMNEALKYQGWDYVYGGSNPNTSFDCSGLVQWCYGKAGISLPRTAQAQYDATQHIPLSQAQAGDLVFFHSTYNAGTYVTHVGIYVGNNQMYHAGDPIGYADLNNSYWQQHLIGAGRIKQ